MTCGNPLVAVLTAAAAAAAAAVLHYLARAVLLSTMLHPTSLLISALLIVQTPAFAFVSTPHCLAGQGRPLRSVESQLRIPRRTYEREQCWGERSTRRRGKRAAATAFGDQGEDVAPER